MGKQRLRRWVAAQPVPLLRRGGNNPAKPPRAGRRGRGLDPGEPKLWSLDALLKFVFYLNKKLLKCLTEILGPRPS